MVRVSRARKVPSQRPIKNAVTAAAGDATVASFSSTQTTAIDAKSLRTDSLSARELNDVVTKQLLAELQYYSKLRKGASVRVKHLNE